MGIDETLTSSKIGNQTVYYQNREEFLNLKREIFVNQVYKLECDNPSPKIIDIGAYIGMSVLYFDKLFPGSSIVCVEPNPTAVQILIENLEANSVTDYQIIEKAVSTKSGKREFFLDPTDKTWQSTGSFSRGTWMGKNISESYMVDTITLVDLVGDGADVVKLDVEGSEQEILTASAECLPLIDQLLIEFHPTKKQNLGEIIGLLHNTHVVEVSDPDEDNLQIIYAKNVTPKTTAPNTIR